MCPFLLAFLYLTLWPHAVCFVGDSDDEEEMWMEKAEVGEHVSLSATSQSISENPVLANNGWRQ